VRFGDAEVNFCATAIGRGQTTLTTNRRGSFDRAATCISRLRPWRAGVTLLPYIMERAKSHRQKFGLLNAILLVGLALAGYLNSLTNGFSPDDQALIVDNPLLRQPSRWGEFWRGSNVTAAVSLYQPVAMTTLGLDAQLWGIETAAGFRKSNTLLHAACVLLLYGLALRLTDRRGLAASIAAVFAVHPAATATVGNLAQRGDLLATLGILAALCCFHAARQDGSVTKYLISFAVFGVALFAGETALLFPLVVGSYLLTFDRGRTQRWVWWWGFLIVEAAYLAVRWNVLGGWGWPVTEARTFSLAQQLALLIQTAGVAARVILVPWQLRTEHAIALSPAGWQLAIGLAGVAVLLAAGFWLIRGRRAVPAEWFGTAWAVATVMPLWLVVRHNGSIAEEWLYLPLAGATIVLCAAVLRGMERTHLFRVSMQTVLVGFAALLAALLWLTIRRNGEMRSATRLLAEALDEAPGSAALRVRYAQQLDHEGQHDRALEQLRLAVEYEPTHAPAHTALGIALGEAGKIEEATEHFREALRLQPGNRRAHFDLALALQRQQQHAEPIEHYREALGGPVFYLDAANNLAWMLATCPGDELRNGAEALQWATRAVQVAGADDMDALDTLAAAFAETGNFEEAARLAHEAAQRAQQRGETALASDIRARAKLYLERRPYREAP
jgi:tetratricopeptide (TPR) repeat protein